MNHAELLHRLWPTGSENHDEGSLVAAEIAVWGGVADNLWTQRDLLVDELLPNRTDALLSRWEAVYGLNRVGGLTDDQRRARLVSSRRRLPNFRPATIDDLAEAYTGLSAEVIEPGPFRCNDANSLTDTSDDCLDGVFVFFVRFSYAAFLAAGWPRDELDELLEIVKPAHVYGWTQISGFYTDSELSLTDRDILDV